MTNNHHKQFRLAFKSMLDLIGNTPLVLLDSSVHGTDNNLFAKLEYFNPTMSMKDRSAKAIIEDYEQKGLLSKDKTIVVPSSGNFGIAMSFICAIKGYKLKIVMSEGMSIERRKLISYYGAELILTDAVKGAAGTIGKAREMEKEDGTLFVIDQNEHSANFIANRDTLGFEIFEQTSGKVDAIVCGVGTGGTISGSAAFLKSKKKDVYAIAVEPDGSNIFSGGSVYIPSELQGMGAYEMPGNFRREYIDSVVNIPKQEAFTAARVLAYRCGIRGGISSGASFYVACEYGKTVSGKNICFIVPDACDRYFSTELMSVAES